MAKSKIPEPLARRHLLEGDLDAARAQAIADAYLEQDREIEAIEFLAKANAREALGRLQAAAVERGDVFLMKSASAALGEEPSVERWKELAEAAIAAGRERDAETARRLSSVDG